MYGYSIYSSRDSEQIQPSVLLPGCTASVTGTLSDPVPSEEGYYDLQKRLCQFNIDNVRYNCDCYRRHVDWGTDYESTEC